MNQLFSVLCCFVISLIIIVDYRLQNTLAWNPTKFGTKPTSQFPSVSDATRVLPNIWIFQHVEDCRNDTATKPTINVSIRFSPRLPSQHSFEVTLPNIGPHEDSIGHLSMGRCACVLEDSHDDVLHILSFETLDLRRSRLNDICGKEAVQGDTMWHRMYKFLDWTKLIPTGWLISPMILTTCFCYRLKKPAMQCHKHYRRCCIVFLHLSTHPTTYINIQLKSTQ